MNAPAKICAECGAELAGDAVRGLCPRCLLQAGLGSQTDSNATVAALGGTGRRGILPDVGAQFGPYRILRLLGRGGMGVVYEAEEQDTGRRLALKVLGRQFDSPSDRARFLREGRLAASINHPNSVYVYGTEEIDDTPTIAMELVSGGTLQQRIKNQGPMPVSVAVDAILQIIAGLEAAQAIGILHRDIKPGNCFEDADGTIKIGDFGLSISTSARAETNITSEGTMVGTPAFCSPEQLRGEELNARADMYSVGATLFFLLTGHVPFDGQNLVQLTANVLEKPAPSPRGFRKEIPKGLAGVIHRCLAKQPGDRFKSYDDLRQALAPFTSTAPTPATLSLRFLAGMLDMFVTGVVNGVVMFLWFGNPMGPMMLAYEHEDWLKAWLRMFVFFSAVILYYAVFEGFWGAAAGKALCRLRVVRPDKTPPGFLRALLRALMYSLLPALPSVVVLWGLYGGNLKAVMNSSMVIQQLIGFSFYIVLALLFCTARRRNGFAAVQDLLTKTRVISRTALESRPLLSTVETPPLAVETKPVVGPYHVLETLETSHDGQWLLGYDLRLLRKVWIHTVPSGTPPVAAQLRNVGRVGRLRWITGRRSPEENWDAFEGVSGKPLLRLITDRQPWRQVRFWLYDLAREISAAERDGTLPSVLVLDRVWISGEGRAKLLDFPAPGLPPAGDASTAPPVPDTGRAQRFLGEVAVAALEGRADAAGKTVIEAAVPLPLHAHNFLKSLPQFSHADAVAGAIQPLLRRPTSVSRLRRAVVVVGCAALPVLMSCFLMFATAMLRQLCPGIMELSSLLQQRQAKFWVKAKNSGADVPGHQNETVTDRQVALFIASHYRAAITNEALWNSPIVLSMIKGDQRQFAEQSVAEHPAPTAKEVAEADAAIEPRLNKFELGASHMPVMIMVTLAVYVCLPALIAALLFRGGLMLWMAGTTFVRRDGRPAGRLRLFWRALVTWSPLGLSGLIPPLCLTLLPVKLETAVIPAVVCGSPLVLYCWLAILSVALPERGLPDRLAGTWPVPR